MLHFVNIRAKNLKVSNKNAVNMGKQTSDTCRKDTKNGIGSFTSKIFMSDGQKG